MEQLIQFLYFMKLIEENKMNNGFDIFENKVFSDESLN